MLRARVPQVAGITLSSHCHNDLGMAVANSLAAVAAGARQVECTINGIGERAGNAALEELAATMMVRRDKFPYTHSLKLERLYPTSQVLSEVISFAPSPTRRSSEATPSRMRREFISTGFSRIRLLTKS